MRRRRDEADAAKSDEAESDSHEERNVEQFGPIVDRLSVDQAHDEPWAERPSTENESQDSAPVETVMIPVD